MDNKIKAMQTHLLLIRRAVGFTSAELGDRIGVTRQTVNNIESGRSVMTKTQYCAICHVLKEEFYNSESDGLMFKLLLELLVIHNDQVDINDTEALVKSAQIMVPAIISREALRKDVSDAWINNNIGILVKYYDLIADSYESAIKKIEKHQFKLREYLKMLTKDCINSNVHQDVMIYLLKKARAILRDEFNI